MMYEGDFYTLRKRAIVKALTGEVAHFCIYKSTQSNYLVAEGTPDNLVDIRFYHVYGQALHDFDKRSRGYPHYIDSWDAGTQDLRLEVIQLIQEEFPPGSKVRIVWSDIGNTGREGILEKVTPRGNMQLGGEYEDLYSWKHNTFVKIAN